MDTDNSTDIASQVSTAGRDGEVLGGLQTVRVNHKVAIVLVHLRGLAPVLVVEELWEGLLLDFVDASHVEPGGIRGDDDFHELWGEELAVEGDSLVLWQVLDFDTESRVHKGLLVLGVGHGQVLMVSLLRDNSSSRSRRAASKRSRRLIGNHG